jgi:hypothetical protein
VEQRARLVVVNYPEPEPGDQDLHHELPIRELLDHVAAPQVARVRADGTPPFAPSCIYEPEPRAGLLRQLHRVRMRPRSVPRHARPRTTCSRGGASQLVPRDGARDGQVTDGWFDLRRT